MSNKIASKPRCLLMRCSQKAGFALAMQSLTTRVAGAFGLFFLLSRRPRQRLRSRLYARHKPQFGPQSGISLDSFLDFGMRGMLGATFASGPPA